MPVTIIPDTGVNNIFVNASTGRFLVAVGEYPKNAININAGGNVLIPNHNALDGKQGGRPNQYYHLTADEYNFLVTGDVLRPSDSGQFYPISNPSGFITGIDLSSYSTIVFATGISGSLQSQINEINAHSGDYYPNDNPSGFITGVDLSSYSSISFVTGVSGDLQDQINILNLQSGDYLLTSNSGLFYGSNNPSGYITGVDLAPYATISQLTETSGVLGFRIDALENSTGDYYLNSNPSGFITVVDLSAYVTGDVVRPEDTGNFYTNDNLSGYITGVDLSSYATIIFTTGISGQLDSRLDTLEGNTGNYYPYSNPSGFITGSVIRPSDTGVFYPRSNPSGFAPSGSLGTLAYQNANNVNILGGAISGLSNFFVSGDTSLQGTTVATGKITANGQGDTLLLSSNDVITRRNLEEFSVLGRFSPIYDLSRSTVWVNGAASGASFTNLTVGHQFRIPQSLTTHLTVSQSDQPQISRLNLSTLTGYGRIDWTGTTFIDIISQAMFGVTTTPFNQYRGVRILHVLGEYRSPLGFNTSSHSCVVSRGVGISWFASSDIAFDCRICVAPSNVSSVIISGATNAGPIVVTTAANHALTTGTLIEIRGVVGNTAANGIWTVTVLSPTTFSLNGSTGNGVYTSSGQWHIVSPVLFTGTIGNLTRLTLSVSSGVASLFANESLVGSLSGAPTIAGGQGQYHTLLENLGVSGVIGGANYAIRSLKIGAIY